MGEARLVQIDRSIGWPRWLKTSDRLSGKFSKPFSYKHIVVDMQQLDSTSQLEKLVKDNIVIRIIDNYDEQLAELFVSKNAQLYKANLSIKRASIKDYLEVVYSRVDPWQKGSWVYYPWNGILLHVLEEPLFEKLRTVRNSYLINAVEQSMHRDFSVACAGMSVGSNGAIAISLTGGSKKIKLADAAVFSGSNLNRVRTGIENIGINKAVVIARELAEMNPYQETMAFTKGVTSDNIERFFEEPWKVDLVIDEVDDIIMKVKLRLEARARRIPVIMVTEPGDKLILDVERYDLDNGLPLFHGLAGGVEDLLTNPSINQREKIKYMMKIIGIDNLPLRDQQAMLKVGSELPSPPQLGSTAMIAGGVLAFAARQLAIGSPLKTGRHAISLYDEFMEKSFVKKEQKEQKRHSKMMKNIIRSL